MPRPGVVLGITFEATGGEGGDDADISLRRGSSGLRGYRPHAAGGGPGRSAARRAVLQGRPRAVRARWRSSVGRVTLRTTGDRRPEDAHDRHQRTGAGRTVAT